MRPSRWLASRPSQRPLLVFCAAGLKHLAGRLVDALRTQESRAHFEAFGFTWKATR